MYLQVFRLVHENTTRSSIRLVAALRAAHRIFKHQPTPVTVVEKFCVLVLEIDSWSKFVILLSEILGHGVLIRFVFGSVTQKQSGFISKYSAIHLV